MTAKPKSAKTTKATKTEVVVTPKDRLLPKLTTFFFDRSIITALLWIALVVFGALSYTTLLKREGFPSVTIPITFVSGTYFVNDPAKVDAEAAKPIVDAALKQSTISTVSSQSSGNFFSVQVQYKEGTDAKSAAAELEEKVKSSGQLPPTVQLQYSVPYFGATGGDNVQIDLAISVYTKNNVPLSDVAAKAEEAATWLKNKNLPLVKSIAVKNPFETVTDPATGKPVTVQRTFDRFGIRVDGKTEFTSSVIIGVAKKEGADVIKLDDEVQAALNELSATPAFADYKADISASFAPSIKDNISELQRVLLEGLVAILVIGSIIIAIRASIITVLAMITTLLLTLALLYVLGYTLNVITLFALILGLALIVDDTIIMTEAIDAARTRRKDPREAVKEATRKISRAMVAATLTACLSFAPLLFVSGVLGSFIRAIPVTIISSLLISLFVALVFIPFFARFLLLRPKQMGNKADKEPAAQFEARLAALIAGPMLWARNSKKRLISVGLTAVFIGIAFLMAGLFIAKDVVFNIFPPTKDTNGLILSITYSPGSTIESAEKQSTAIDDIAARELGDNYVQSSYYATGSDQSAMEQIELISYGKRDVTSQQLAKQLQKAYDSELTDEGLHVQVGQLDVGPPTNAFIIQLDASNREAAFAAASDLVAFLEKTELKRINGKLARFTNITAANPNQYQRSGDKQIVTVSSGFDGDDTSTLTTLAQTAVKKEFDGNKLKQYGLKDDALKFDLGQESENQDSFKTLALAFPLLMFVIFLLLALEFKSLLQPLLIFMAIPFSIFGVMLGLRLTHNAISFFTMLGFFALIGLSLKNTILLTDFANQSRRAGLPAIDAAVAALEERFRPLFATSITAVFSLIPLALSSPFWQGLAVVLIFGLLSSTLLVLTVFPYYYLGGEYLRLHISARGFILWAILTGAVSAGLGMITSPAYGLLMIPASLVVVLMQRYYARRLVR